MSCRIIEKISNSQRIEGALRYPADKFSANPVPGIDSRLVQADGNPPFSQRDAQGKPGQAAADDGDHSFHASNRNEPRQSTDSSTCQLSRSEQSAQFSGHESRVNARGQIMPGDFAAKRPEQGAQEMRESRPPRFAKTHDSIFSAAFCRAHQTLVRENGAKS